MTVQLKNDTYQMKKLAMQVLKMYPSCDICGKLASVVHRMDELKSDFDITNYVPLCRTCHTGICNVEIVRFLPKWDIKKIKKKLIDEYHTTKGIGNALGISHPTVSRMLYKGNLTARTAQKVANLLRVDIKELRLE